MTPPHCPRNFSTPPQRLSSDSLKQFQGPRRPPALHPQITAPKAVPTFPQLDKGTWGQATAMSPWRKEVSGVTAVSRPGLRCCLSKPRAGSPHPVQQGQVGKGLEKFGMMSKSGCCPECPEGSVCQNCPHLPAPPEPPDCPSAAQHPPQAAGPVPTTNFTLCGCMVAKCCRVLDSVED